MSPKLRPLSSWIRELHQDELRLHVMVITEWVESGSARAAERARIVERMAQRLQLLNVEQETLGSQMILV